VKLEDLKTGQLALLTNRYSETGNIYMVINETLVRPSGYLCIKDLDLTADWKLTKVSKVLDYSNLMPKFWTINTLDENLLWEHKKEIDWGQLPIIKYKYSYDDFYSVFKVISKGSANTFTGVLLYFIDENKDANRKQIKTNSQFNIGSIHLLPKENALPLNKEDYI